MIEFITDKIEIDLIDTPPEIQTEGRPPYSVSKQTVSMRWQFELEYRSWGVKDISISVPDQTIAFDIEREAEHWPDDDEAVTIHLTDVQVESQPEAWCLSPKSLEFYNGKWTLKF